MPKVLRYDTAELREPINLDNGYVKADGRLTRTGIFTYKLANGDTRRELRTPEEVFKADAMASFDLVPLTVEHPREQLTSKNTRKYSVGVVSGARQDGDFVRADILIQDADAIEKAKAGKRELSCGYRCDLDMTPGITDQGERYDAVQRNIMGNHVALVSLGRAGRDATLRLDDSDAVLVEEPAGLAPHNPNKPEKETMAKINIDGVDFEVSEQAAQAIAKVQARADSATEKLDAANKQAETEKARADKAEEDRDAAVKERNDAQSDDKVRAQVAARLELERAATKVLGDKAAEMKLDEMSAVDVRKAVVLAVSPEAEAKLDGCSEDYLAARFDHAVESFKAEKKDDTPKPRWAKADVEKEDGDRFDAASARARMLKENQERGRRPLTAKAG